MIADYRIGPANSDNNYFLFKTKFVINSIMSEVLIDYFIGTPKVQFLI